MKRVLMAVLCLAACAGVAPADERRHLSGSHPVDRGDTVRIDFKVGALRVETAATDRIEVDLTVRCKGWGSSRCHEELEELELEFDSFGREVSVRILGDRKLRSRRIEVDGTIVVPASSPLEIDMGIGDLDVRGASEDVSVDMGIGEVTVWMPGDKVKSVSVDAGIGDASIRGSDRRVTGSRSMLIGAEAEWRDGPGNARVVVDLGIGEASVRLQDEG